MTELVGLIPAAGRAIRLDWPVAKELWPIKEGSQVIPVLHKTMMNMSQSGANHLVIVTRSGKPEIFVAASEFDESVDVSYVCQKDFTVLGTSSGLTQAINSAYHLIKEKHVLFGMPDTIVTIQNEVFPCYIPLLNILNSGYDLAFGLFETEEPWKYGMMHLQDTGEPIAVIDKPNKSALTYMWGILAWSSRFTKMIHDFPQLNFTTHLLNKAIQELSAKCYMYDGSYSDLGTRDDVLKLFK